MRRVSERAFAICQNHLRMLRTPNRLGFTRLSIYLRFLFCCTLCSGRKRRQHCSRSYSYIYIEARREWGCHCNGYLTVRGDIPFLRKFYLRFSFSVKL